MATAQAILTSEHEKTLLPAQQKLVGDGWFNVDIRKIYGEPTLILRASEKLMFAIKDKIKWPTDTFIDSTYKTPPATYRVPLWSQKPPLESEWQTAQEIASIMAHAADPNNYIAKDLTNWGYIPARLRDAETIMTINYQNWGVPPSMARAAAVDFIDSVQTAVADVTGLAPAINPMDHRKDHWRKPPLLTKEF